MDNVVECQKNHILNLSIFLEPFNDSPNLLIIPFHFTKEARFLISRSNLPND